mmetsp:Transcript_35562/g.83076  ORF Transcript_35562/g.83076 Transcript_35562/m.83076 type:complete len:93 (+) Transcript_35562:1314-1592(+)
MLFRDRKCTWDQILESKISPITRLHEVPNLNFDGLTPIYFGPGFEGDNVHILTTEATLPLENPRLADLAWCQWVEITCWVKDGYETQVSCKR